MRRGQKFGSKTPGHKLPPDSVKKEKTLRLKGVKMKESQYLPTLKAEVCKQAFAFSGAKLNYV